MAKRSLLRKEIRQLRRDLRKADLRSTDLRFIAVDRSTDLATGELKGRLSLLNELRGNVVDRGEFNTKMDALSEKIDDLKGSRRTGFATVGAIVVGVAVVIGVMAQIIILIVNHA